MMMSAAETIKRVRMNLLLQQEAFAELLDLTKQSISNYETGKRKPKLSVIRKIKELAKEHGIEVSVDDFLN